MQTVINPEDLYSLNEPCLPQILCCAKNRAVVVGRISSELEEQDGCVSFELCIEGGESRIKIVSDKKLLQQKTCIADDTLVILGTFQTYYRKLRMYRPLIHIVAEQFELLPQEWIMREQLQKGFYPNRVYIEGVISENPVKYTAMEGNSTLNLCVLSNGVEIPCTVSQETLQEAGSDIIVRNERYRMWGVLTLRYYQKRLGKGMILQTETMSEVCVQKVQSLGLTEPVPVTRNPGKGNRYGIKGV